MAVIDNNQLFSAVYLRELQAAQQDLERLAGARSTIREWRDEFPDLQQPGTRLDFVRQTISALGVCYGIQEQQDCLTLYSDPSRQAATGLCLVLEEADLGKTCKGSHPQARMIQNLRKASLRWGVITNGRRWRLCFAEAPAPYEVFLQADLDALIGEKALADFLVFYRFFGGEAFGMADGALGLDRFCSESAKRTDAIERHLKSQVEPILQKLCLGFVEDEATEEYSPETLQTVYQNAIYLLYRILFLFYAEARGLLPVDRAEYRAVSLASLVDAASQRERDGASDADEHSLWRRLTRLFVVVDDGDSALGVSAYNGGLFSDMEKPYLKRHSIRDDYLSAALFALGFEATKTGYARIDYRDLSERHLGTLYEGMLEYRLNRVEREPVVVRDSGDRRMFVSLSHAGAVKKGEVILEVGQVYFADDKGERKASGSYYTPEDVVQYIVSNTVTPKLLERRKPFDAILEDAERERAIAPTPEQRNQLEHYADVEALKAVEQGILTLRILDPAMGSGHFLVAATQTITDFIIETLNATEWHNERISTDPLFWKRRVVERCIYGVDKNPLAHELAKLSLWVASASAGKPLTFLDHHLKQGNSLYGTPLSRLSSLPNSKKQSDDPLFRTVREEVIASVLAELAGITQTDSDTIETVKWKGEANRTARNTLERLRMIADLWLATLFGLKTESGRAITDDEYARFLSDLTCNYADEAWQARVNASHVLQQARRIADGNNFFHWELEFPDSVFRSECIYDAVIMNPPYVGTQPNTAISALYESSRAGDLYSWLFEKGIHAAGRTGGVGAVVPLSVTFSSRLASLRKVILRTCADVRIASFDNIPDCIFNSGKQSENTNTANSQRVCVVTLQGTPPHNTTICTTDFLRWRGGERDEVLHRLRFTDTTAIATTESFPKIGTADLACFWRRLQDTDRRISTLASVILGEGNQDHPARYFLIVPRAIRYFVSAVPFRVNRNKTLTLVFDTAEARDLAMVLLNSNVHYWYWRAVGDGFATNAEIVGSFPAPRIPAGDLAILANRLNSAFPECRVSKLNSGIEVPNVNLNKRIEILMDIDDAIVRQVAPDLKLPRDIFAQYKSNSFLRPLDVAAIAGSLEAAEE